MAEDQREDVYLGVGRSRSDQGRITHDCKIPELSNSAKPVAPILAPNRYTDLEVSVEMTNPFLEPVDHE